MSEQKTYARIENGVVIETFALPDVDISLPKFDAKGAVLRDEGGNVLFEQRKAGVYDFHHPSTEWIECPAEVQASWVYDGQEFVAPVAETPPPPTSWEDKLRAFLTANPDVAQGLQQQ